MKKILSAAVENPVKVFGGAFLLSVSLLPFFGDFSTILPRSMHVLISLMIGSTIVASMVYYLNNRDFFINVYDHYEIKKLLKNTKELRIFASGSETYRTLLENALSDLDYKGRLKIKILVRSDGNPERDKKLKDAEENWKKKIDKKKSEVINATTEMKSYNFKISLRGMIFDNKTAILGWYHHDEDRTEGYTITSVVYKASNKQAKEIIEFSIRTFDDIFERRAKKISK